MANSSTSGAWKPSFLEALRTTGNATVAAKTAGIDRANAYKARRRSKVFARQWNEAIEHAVDLLEKEARRRAEEGVQEPIYYKGELVGHIRKYSDALMMFLLKAHRPDKYRDNIKVDHAGQYRHACAGVQLGARGGSPDAGRRSCPIMNLQRMWERFRATLPLERKRTLTTETIDTSGNPVPDPVSSPVDPPPPEDPPVEEATDEPPIEDIADVALPPIRVRLEQGRKAFDDAIGVLAQIDTGLATADDAIRQLEDRLATARKEQTVRMEGRDQAVASATAASANQRALYREFEASIVG